MKFTKVTYARLYNLGNYENERLEVEIELEEGDTPYAGLHRAKDEVEAAHAHNQAIREEQAEAERQAQRERWRSKAEDRVNPEDHDSPEDDNIGF